MLLTRDPAGSLGVVDFNCDECAPTGSSRTIERVPSFFVADSFHNYDKTGASILIAAIKGAFFGSPSKRMTQTQMEAFFDEPKNFVSF